MGATCSSASGVVVPVGDEPSRAPTHTRAHTRTLIGGLPECVCPPIHDREAVCAEALGPALRLSTVDPSGIAVRNAIKVALKSRDCVIAHGYRWWAYQYLSGGVELAEVYPSLYRGLLQLGPAVAGADTVMRHDVHRTLPNVPFFGPRMLPGPGQSQLYRILTAYSHLDPAVGYTQGMNFVVAMLLLAGLSEHAAFYAFASLMLRFGLRFLYLPKLPGAVLCHKLISAYLRHRHRRLFKRLEKVGLTPLLFATPWLMSFFVSSPLPLSSVLILLDRLLLETPLAPIPPLVHEAHTVMEGAGAAVTPPLYAPPAPAPPRQANVRRRSSLLRLGARVLGSVRRDDQEFAQGAPGSVVLPALIVRACVHLVVIHASQLLGADDWDAMVEIIKDEYAELPASAAVPTISALPRRPSGEVSSATAAQLVPATGQSGAGSAVDAGALEGGPSPQNHTSAHAFPLHSPPSNPHSLHVTTSMAMRHSTPAVVGSSPRRRARTWLWSPVAQHRSLPPPPDLLRRMPSLTVLLPAANGNTDITPRYDLAPEGSLAAYGAAVSERQLGPFPDSFAGVRQSNSGVKTGSPDAGSALAGAAAPGPADGAATGISSRPPSAGGSHSRWAAPSPAPHARTTTGSRPSTAETAMTSLPRRPLLSSIKRGAVRPPRQRAFFIASIGMHMEDALELRASLAAATTNEHGGDMRTVHAEASNVAGVAGDSGSLSPVPSSMREVPPSPVAGGASGLLPIRHRAQLSAAAADLQGPHVVENEGRQRKADFVCDDKPCGWWALPLPLLDGLAARAMQVDVEQLVEWEHAESAKEAAAASSAR